LICAEIEDETMRVNQSETRWRFEANLWM